MMNLALRAAVGTLMIAVGGCTTTLGGHSLVQAAGSGHPGAASAGASGTNEAGSQTPDAGAASSSGEGASPGAPGPDGAAHPCELLPKAQAEALAGTPLLPGIESGQGADKTLCQYAGPTTGPLAQVQIIVGDGAKKELDIDRGVLKHAFTTLTGVGDEAYEEDNQVFLRKGDTWVSVSLVRLNDPAQNVKAIQAAAGEVARHLAGG